MSEKSGSPVAGFVLGTDGTPVEWMGEFDDCAGRESPLEVVVPADRVELRSAVGRCIGTGWATADCRLRHRDGQFEFRLRRLTDAEGRPIRVYATVSETAANRSASGSGRLAAGDD